MLVAWNNDHALGYDIVDDGHRLVIDTINRLNATTNAAQWQGVLDQMVEVLNNHLTRQFEHEDALLMLSRSPGHAAHAAEHRALLAVLKNAHAGHVSGMLLLNLISFLGQHLRGTDRAAFAQPIHLAA